MTERRDPAMEVARRRARALRDFYMHIITYVLVCALLVIIDVATGSSGETFLGLDWAYWPIMGWGLFVVMHGIRVAIPADRWEERKAQELYEQERERELHLH